MLSARFLCFNILTKASPKKRRIIVFKEEYSCYVYNRKKGLFIRRIFMAIRVSRR